jgi:hypothetical protein
MPTTTKQIIRDVLGRMAAEAPPALKFEELAQPVVTAGKSGRRSTAGPRLAWVGAAVVVVVLLVGAVLVVRPGPDGTTPVGAAAPASVEEFRAALVSGFEELEQAEGIEGLQEAAIQGHLSARVWFTTGPGGDTVVIQQADVDVRDSAWWLTSISPPAEGERIVTDAWVTVDGVTYEAGSDSGVPRSWQVVESGPARSFAFALMFLDPTYSEQFRAQLSPTDADVTRQATVNGGAIWLASYSGGGQSRVYIHPEGHVASWSWFDFGPVEIDGQPVDSGEVSYSPLAESPSITLPTVGSPFDLAELDAPENFPLGG